MSQTYSTVIELQPYRYQMIRGLDFYRFARQELSAFPKVEFRQGTVERIEDGDERATVSVDGQTYTAQWVFDSCFRLSSFVPDPGRYHYLHQQFYGWEIVA